MSLLTERYHSSALSFDSAAKGFTFGGSLALRDVLMAIPAIPPPSLDVAATVEDPPIVRGMLVGVFEVNAVEAGAGFRAPREKPPLDFFAGALGASAVVDAAVRPLLLLLQFIDRRA